MTTRRRRDAAGVAAGVLALVTTLATFLPWGRSGQRRRSSYQLIDVADRAGVLPSGWSSAATLLYLAPAACGVVLVALAARRHTVAGLATTTLGALVGTAAILVARSPLVAEPATRAAVLLGAGTTLSGVAVLVTARKETAG